MKEKFHIGDWETDSQGRRFRRIGNGVEYMATVQTSNGTVFVDELEEHNRRMAEQRDERIKQENKRLKKEPKGVCPLKGSNITKCVGNCAFFDGENCMIAGDIVPEVNTTDRLCPFLNVKCNDLCMIYKNGCTLVERLKRGLNEA